MLNLGQHPAYDAQGNYLHPRRLEEVIDRLRGQNASLKMALIECMKHVPAHVEEQYRSLLEV